MRSRLSRFFAAAAAIVGAASLAIGLWSCVVGIAGNVGPFALTRETHLWVDDGVVHVRQITGYEPPVSSSDWHDIDPLKHPERISPVTPGFPWFGYSADRQTGVAIPLPGADVDSIHSDRPYRIIPRNTRLVFFPIWLPAALLLAPWAFALRNRRKRPASTGRYTPPADRQLQMFPT